jgi:hypothetical protein
MGHMLRGRRKRRRRRWWRGHTIYNCWEEYRRIF